MGQGGAHPGRPAIEGPTLVELVLAGDEAAVLERLRALECAGHETVASEITCGEYGGRGAKSALHCAAQSGRASIVRCFLEYSADAAIVDDAFNTPLHFAAEAGHARAAHLLLKAGAKADAGNGFGRTPAQHAEEEAWDKPYVRTGKAHIRKMLEGDFQAFDSLPPEPLAAAAAAPAQQRGHQTARGAPCPPQSLEAQGGRRASAPSVVDCGLHDEGAGLLAELAKTGNLATVEERLKELVASGGPEAARMEVANCEESLNDARIAQSSLHVASRRGYSDMLRMLLSTNASPNVTNDQWNTPLHLAAESGKSEAVEVLLEAGADPLIRNSFGRSAEELAFVKQFDSPEVAQGKALIQKMLRKVSF